jgi:hypothetical protein
MAKSTLSKAGEIGGVAVVGGGLLYLVYEGYEYVRYTMWKRKSASNTMTFSQWKVTKPA